MYTEPAEDYDSVTMMKTFTPSDTLQCIDVTILPDEIFEYYELINVTLIVVADERVILGDQFTTDIRIIDDQSKL